MTKAADDQFGVHAAPDHLDCRRMLELVGTPGQIDRTHAATSDAPLDDVGANLLPEVGIHVGGVVDGAQRWRLEERASLCLGLEERFHFSTQLRLAGAQCVQQRRASVSRLIDREPEDLFHSGPTRHVGARSYCCTNRPRYRAW